MFLNLPHGDHVSFSNDEDGISILKIKKWTHEKDLLELNIKARAAETENELKIVTPEGTWGGFRDSLQAEGTIKDVHRVVNDVRSMFRPFLTVLLWVLAGWVFYEVVDGRLKTWFKEMEIAFFRYPVR